MKLCPSCGTRYEDAAKFCQHDGALLRSMGRGGEEEDPYIGKVLLGQFEVQELIGTGGMGRVYKARQLGFDRPVAVKILHHELVENQEMVKRFNREARIISRLAHEAIIHVYLFGELADGNLYLAMEYLDGRPLTELIDEGPVPGSRALHITTQILSALEEAHGKGVVHRDLKPDNIMLVRRGADPDTVKVLDFGIAKFLGSRTMLTQQGLVFGSARYISPEAAAGEDVDERADLYAVGVILYHMLAGAPPFDDPSAVTLLMRHVNDEPPQLADQPGARAVPRLVSTVVMRALEKDPASRIQTAGEMRAALIDAAQGGGVVLAGRPSSLARPSLALAPSPPLNAAPSQETQSFGTKPMYGHRLDGQAKGVDIGTAPTKPAPSIGAAVAAAVSAAAVAPSASTTAPATPAEAATSATEPSAASMPAETGTTEPAPPWGPAGGSAPMAVYDDDDEPLVPRSKAWMVLLIVGLLALVGGAVAALVVAGRPRVTEEEEATPPAAAAEAPDGPAPREPPAEATEPSEPETMPEVEETPLVAVAPEGEGGAASPPSKAPETSRPSGEEGRRPRARDGPSGSRGGGAAMPPSATLRVHPRRPRVGAAVRIVAKVSPPSKLRSPRFLISKRGSSSGSSRHRASPGGEPGLYSLAHRFADPGSYQITFVATSGRGELRAFADATVSGASGQLATRPEPPSTPEPEERPGPGDTPSAPSNSEHEEDKPPEQGGPPWAHSPWLTPLPAPPPAPSPF